MSIINKNSVFWPSVIRKRRTFFFSAPIKPCQNIAARVPSCLHNHLINLFLDVFLVAEHSVPGSQGLAQSDDQSHVMSLFRPMTCSRTLCDLKSDGSLWGLEQADNSIMVHSLRARAVHTQDLVSHLPVSTVKIHASSFNGENTLIYNQHWKFMH